MQTLQSSLNFQIDANQDQMSVIFATKVKL